MQKKYISEKILTRYMNSIGYKLINPITTDIKTKEEKNITLYSNIEGIDVIECLGDKFLGAYIKNGCYISFNKAQDHYYGNGFEDNKENPYISPLIELYYITDSNKNKELYIEIDTLINWIGIERIKNNLNQYIVEIDLDTNKEKIDLLCSTIIDEIKKTQKNSKELNYFDNSKLYDKLLSIYNNITNFDKYLSSSPKETNKSETNKNNSNNNFVKQKDHNCDNNLNPEIDDSTKIFCNPKHIKSNENISKKNFQEKENIQRQEKKIENQMFNNPLDFDFFLKLNNIDKSKTSQLDLEKYYKKYQTFENISKIIKNFF